MYYPDEIEKITSLPEYYRNGCRRKDTFRYFTIVNPVHFDKGVTSEAYRQVREYEEQKSEIERIRRTVLEPFVGNAFRGMKEAEYQQFLNEMRKDEKRKVDIEKVNKVSGVIVLFFCVLLLVLGFCVPKLMPSLGMWYFFILIAWLPPQEHEEDYWSLRRFIFYRSFIVILCLIAVYSFIHQLI